MSRIVRNVGDVAAVKSKGITLPPDRSGAHTNGNSAVDLHSIGKANGKRDLPAIGCPETNGLLFPMDCLEGAMRAITEEVSRQERNPCGLAAACVIGTVSAAIGKGLKIHSLVNKTCPANVYILVGTPSGQGKSETMRQIIKPLRLYEDERIQDWEHNVKGNLEAQERRFKSQIKGMERRLSSPTFKGNPQAVQEQLETAIRSLGTISKRLLAPPRLILENATCGNGVEKRGEGRSCRGDVKKPTSRGN